MVRNSIKRKLLKLKRRVMNLFPFPYRIKSSENRPWCLRPLMALCDSGIESGCSVRPELPTRGHCESANGVSWHHPLRPAGTSPLGTESTSPAQDFVLKLFRTYRVGHSSVALILRVSSRRSSLCTCELIQAFLSLLGSKDGAPALLSGLHLSCNR